MVQPEIFRSRIRSLCWGEEIPNFVKQLRDFRLSDIVNKKSCERKSLFRNKDFTPPFALLIRKARSAQKRLKHLSEIPAAIRVVSTTACRFRKEGCFMNQVRAWISSTF